MTTTHPNPYRLTPADRQAFDEKGYWVSPALFDAGRVESLRRAHERIWARDYDVPTFPLYPDLVRDRYEPHKLRKLDNGWWLNDTVRDVVTDGQLGKMAAELLGCERVRLWQDQVIYKPPTGDAGVVGNVGWHQDYSYWKSSETTNMLTIWIALQDTDLDNGGMRSIAGSQRWGLIEDSDTFFDQNLEGLEAKYGHLGDWADEPCIIPAGGASFHHGLTFHGSGPNHSNEPRLSIVAHVMPDGTAYSGDPQYHANVHLLGPRPHVGQKFDNAFFPLMDR
ncbi:MAG: phytanoyl-CoA dioxygenase family protein [Planctomycetota bacterium]